METLKGNLLRDGQNFAEGVEGRITIDQVPNRTPVWSGFFNLPTGTAVAVGDVFELVLADGQANKIKLERVNMLPHAVTCSFGTEG